MLWNIRSGILIIASILQLFFYLTPCLCLKSIPLWNCIPICFQVPIVKQHEVSPSLPFPLIPISSGEDHARQQIQVQQQKQYISGESYPKHFSSSGNFHQLNDVNIPEQQQQQQQQQQYEEDESWQSDEQNGEPIIYIAETTPHPYDEIIDEKKLISEQSQPVSMSNQYDMDYLLEALNDLTTISATSMYPLTTTDIEDTLEDSKNNLQRTSFNVLKRQKKTKDAFKRNYPAKRAIFPSAVCNSRRLKKVILQAITDDVSESKRRVTEAAEYAYQGIKFDVICAEGDFSYTIHAKKYCEVTKKDITCFAFR
ncbi:Ground-like domain containing protein [Brugia malayi]|uniref:Bm5810 n=1 Tax=Brugia malayi TaxID=6279 RepID=A0A0H5S291_BRUMA|nr:Ground-like domain containing protein [Brugia malayi]CRZ22324.1 Bm5810 [Brugia malayi]VIO99164.1 Ground-like domain containing protein [Brugia malayi]